MKYSLMSLMIDKELKIKKPSFIQVLIMRNMGYQGPEPTVDEMFAFFTEHGMPSQNGSMTFEDYVKFAKENGFDGLDMMSFHFEEDGAEAKKILDQYDMTLSSVNIISTFSECADEEALEKAFQEVKAVIDNAAAAGCKSFLVTTGYFPGQGMTREQVFQSMVKGLTKCVEYGKELGVVINTETLESVGVPFCATGEMLRLFEAVPGLMYTHDTGNPIVAMEDPIATYNALKDRVVSVHFKDLEYTENKTMMMNPMGRFLDRAFLGEGEIDFKKHLELLKRDGYQGFITIEGQRPADNQLDGAIAALKFFREMEASL